MRAIDKFILGAAALSGVLLVGCDQRYVRRDEFNAAMGELRGEDSRQRVATEELRGEDARLRAESEQLKVAFEDRISDHDVKLTELKQGRVRIDLAMNFEYKQTELRAEDRQTLDEFAQAAQERGTNVFVTVEGFTDSKGSAAYNRRLGQARADIVRDYLIQAGLRPGQVRAISYGEDPRRQVLPNAAPDQAFVNRRVTLVVEYAPKHAGADLRPQRPGDQLSSLQLRRRNTETAAAP